MDVTTLRSEAEARRMPVSERPILFSGPMVRAILDGRKTQTRRIAKFEPIEPGFNLGFSGVKAGHYCTGVPSSGHVLYSRRGDSVWEQRTKVLHCPYGLPGDRLWVRETWSLDFLAGYTEDRREWSSYELTFKADSQTRKLEYDGPSSGDPYARWYDNQRGDWRPSIHMPRWASRLTLEIADVRVERLLDISVKDVCAEGLLCLSKDNGRTYKYGLPDRDGLPGGCDDGWPWQDWSTSHVDAFRRLWDSINAERGYGSDLNPWAWVIEFKRVPTGGER